MTDIVDRAKTMIGVIDHSREQAVQHAYSDRAYQDALAELVAEVETAKQALDQLDQANAALERVRALCEPVLTEYVDDGEPVLAQAILDVIRGSR